MSNRIVISVGIASYPIAAAGNTWWSINWAHSFRKLGWDVWLVEAISRNGCVDESWKSAPFDTSANYAYWRRITDDFGFAGRCTLLVDHDASNLAETRDFAEEAEIFLNMSGHFRSEAIQFPRARKVYLDGDPAFTQIWAERYGCDMNFAGHDVFFSLGHRIGKASSFAPTCGIDWLPTFTPVPLDYWPHEGQSAFAKFTTVAHWEGFKDSEWRGQWFTGKRPEFQRLATLPRRLRAPMEIATHVSVHETELGPCREGGWRFAEAQEICRTMQGYHDYLRESSAEFSVAKGGYVLSQTGWFGDRSVCYAALGRPLVLQDTGLAEVVPVGEGIHLFRNLDEAAAACERVFADFPTQQGKARQLAEEYFAAEKVIPALLSKL